jgi:hypothetical protein
MGKQVHQLIFFLKMGASPQPLHQSDAHGCILLTNFKVLKFTSHLATKVAA